MIQPELYKWIYLFLVTVLTFVVYPKYKNRNGSTLFNYSETFNIIIVLFFIFFIGLRPTSGVFSDMKNYADYYEMTEGMPFSLDLKATNKVFDNLLSFWESFRLGFNNFCLLCAAIYFGATYLGVRRLFPEHKLAAYIVFLSAFSTFSYSTNGIKAGAAAALFILALSYRENLMKCIPLVLLSWGFHHSMTLPVAALALTHFYKNPKWYFYGWGLCVVLAFAHVSYFQNLFAGMTDEQGVGYLKGSGETIKTSVMSGFRIDFILYSAMPVLVGYYAEMKKKLDISPMYRTILHFYLCTNGVWMLCMYAEFTNRIAYLSWFLYPIVLIYPFLQEDWGENRYRMFAKVMLYHLAFTLFMEVIYYQFINVVQ